MSSLPAFIKIYLLSDNSLSFFQFPLVKCMIPSSSIWQGPPSITNNLLKFSSSKLTNNDFDKSLTPKLLKF